MPLAYTDTTAAGATFAPGLNQVFFIGDGWTGTGAGSVQQFTVPATATRLFLGFVDAPGVTGPPGTYGDNTGSLTATVQVAGLVTKAPVSYATRNGDQGSYTYFDDTFTGSGCRTCAGVALSGGLGQLTDLAIGATPWYGTDLGYGMAYEWLGWLNVDPAPVFDFGSPQTFTEVRTSIRAHRSITAGIWIMVLLSFLRIEQPAYQSNTLPLGLKAPIRGPYPPAGPG